MSNIEFHPAANIFPVMTGEEFDALVEDVREHRLQVPIELYEGQILDGRNRYKACQEIGIDVDEHTKDVTGYVNDQYSGDPVSHVLSLNLHRRHLDTSQRAMIAGRARELYDEEARKRMLAGKKVDPVANSP